MVPECVAPPICAAQLAALSFSLRPLSSAPPPCTASVAPTHHGAAERRGTAAREAMGGPAGAPMAL